VASHQPVLIIVPPVLIEQWIQAIKQHTNFTLHKHFGQKKKSETNVEFIGAGRSNSNRILLRIPRLDSMIMKARQLAKLRAALEDAKKALKEASEAKESLDSDKKVLLTNMLCIMQYGRLVASDFMLIAQHLHDYLEPKEIWELLVNSALT